MAFVQIMEITTSKYDGIADLDRQWREATEGKRTLRREIIARDRTIRTASSSLPSSIATSPRWRTPTSRRPRNSRRASPN